MSKGTFSRGSEWRQWDLHVHTPASFHWKGSKFDADPTSEANRRLVDEMIAALNAAEPRVFALMDYWTFDGWFALKRRLKEPGAPPLTKTVFPGIELRLAAPTRVRLNAHVLFADDVEDQILNDFKAALHVEIINRPLSDSSLIGLARLVGEDKLLESGLTKALVDGDDQKALLAGSKIAELNCESYKNAIAKVPNECAIGFMPYDTSDGLDEVDWHKHYAYFLGLFGWSPIFESRNSVLRSAFVGEEIPENTKFFQNFQKGLNYIPRLVVSGSDAHRFVGTKGDNDKRGYGDFPSGKITWIKADPTFKGLQQAIREPAKRSFIGSRPPKLVEVIGNKTFFIDSIEIKKESAASPEKWLDGVNLPLNPDLIAIIGNKGSGKSALADVIALLGNSRQKMHFSFLKKDRFRGKSGDPARQFVGRLNWLDGTPEERNLNDDPTDEKVERVRYIPQNHFEELCNSHVSGKSDAFENELRAVIFSHASDDIRLGALNFDQLIEQQERSFRSRLNELRKDLKGLNQTIAACEEQLQPEVKKSIQEKLALKMRELDEHQKIKPVVVSKPTDQLSAEQQAVATELDGIAERFKALEDLNGKSTVQFSINAAKAMAIQNVREHVRLLERAYQQFVEEAAKDLSTLGLNPSELVSFASTIDPLNQIEAQVIQEQSKLKQDATTSEVEKTSLIQKRAELQAKLNAPQLLYQQGLKEMEAWTAKLSELTGAPDAPDSQEGLTARIAQLDKLPTALDEHRRKRDALSGEIFDILNSQREAREKLFKPVQDLIQKNSLIRDEYKLQFRASLVGSIDAMSSTLFTLIKQNTGDFRGGDDDSFGAVRKIAEPLDFNKRDDALAFAKQLHDKIQATAGSSGKASVGIGSILRKDKPASDVYDLVYGLTFLEPRYSLLFQDTAIEQLSPGQRGALLLIFYLLVDTGRTPIILDQPEENLDNETVVSLLVPVVTEAKKRRQIIMVTHNPNLAVVCDAEQIVWASFDRKDESKITYTAGAIECPSINKHVVDVLEGTKRAFNNRRVKYH